MRREDLMKADLFSEVLLIAVGVLLFLPLLITVLAAVGHTLGLA